MNLHKQILKDIQKDTDFEHIESLKKLIDEFRENNIEIVSVGQITENITDDVKFN